MHANIQMFSIPFSASDIQRRIELIQDFEMPTVSTSIKVSRDGNFILATGQMRCLLTASKMIELESLSEHKKPVD